MEQPEVYDFFSFNIIDFSVLEDITVETLVYDRHLPDYYLLTGPSHSESLIQGLEDYNINSCNNSKWHIASMKGSNHLYIPEAHYKLVNVTDKIRGLVVSMRDVEILYINLEDCDNRDIIRIQSVIEKLHPPQYRFHIICLQSKRVRKLSGLANWTDHPLDRKSYCLRYQIEFQVFINKNERIYNIDLNKTWTQDITVQKGNIGIEINIPHISDTILNTLDRCYNQDLYRGKLQP